jgi:hypothetical protein
VYIQRLSIIKNSAVEVSDERAIDAFTLGLQRGDLVEEMGIIKPKIVSDLMDISNRFAVGEDACNNKRTRSPEDDRGNRYGGQRRRSRNYDNYNSHSQVAAGYKDNVTKGMTAEAWDTVATEKKTTGAAKNFRQKNPESTTHTRGYAKRTMPHTLCVR